jgi:uncharacterized membrane protein YfcA
MLHDIILLFVGFVVGGMNAIAGGGMLIGFPVLLAVGIPPIVANATISLIVLPGGVASTFGYRKYLKRVPIQYLWLVVPAVIGSVSGAVLLRNTSHSTFAEIIPLLILFAVALFAFQPFLYQYLHRHIHGSTQLRKRVGPLFVVSLAVLPLAIYGAYFGAGFGFIMLSFLGFTKLHNHLHRMNALKTSLAVVVATSALLSLANSGLIDWHNGLVMGAGTLVGGYSAAVGSQKISTTYIRAFIIVVGLVTAVYLGLRSY